MRKSIYEVMLDNVTADGHLIPSFSLPDENASPNELKFMPGAKDGIGIFHMGVGNEEEVIEEIIQLFGMHCHKFTSFQLSASCD